MQLFMMWVKHVYKPMTGNGKHTNYKNGDDWGMGCYCVTHIIGIWLDGLWKSQLLVDPQNMIEETDRGTEILRSNMDLFQ